MTGALGLFLSLSFGFPSSARAQEEPSAVEVEPYGLVATSFFWASSPMVNVDAPIAALPGTSSSLGATARQSRIGARARSGPVTDALSATTAVVLAEIDFFGGWYAENDITYAMSHPRLRLFHTRVEWDAVALVVGQDWIVFSPLNPASVVHVAVAGFQGAGNAWARLPQVKLELAAGGVTATAAVLAPVAGGPVADDASPGLTVGRVPGPADRSETPSIQGRLAYGVAVGNRTLTAGVSGHYGREQVTHGDPAQSDAVRSWGAAIDLDVPVLSLLSFKAELMAGANLDGLFVNADVIDGEAVRALGAWSQLTLRIAALELQLGAGIEDASAPEGRTLPDGAIDLNAAVYAAVCGRAGPVTAGLELSHLWTERAGSSETARGTHVAVGALVPF